jgi:propanediol dehydratase small subunit
MTTEKLGLADYPIAEKSPDRLRTATGKQLAEIDLDSVRQGRIRLEDLRITAEALRRQAEIADAAGRPTLAQNFRRAAELTAVPQDVIFRVYELLRPGRAKSRADLDAAADKLEADHGARLMAAFVREAAALYEKRRLFGQRF